jgi:hypothetical protein
VPWLCFVVAFRCVFFFAGKTWKNRGVLDIHQRKNESQRRSLQAFGGLARHLPHSLGHF